MKKRIIGGIIITLITIPCFFINKLVFAIFANLVGMLALYELIGANKDLKKLPLFIKLLSFISIPLLAFTNIKDAYYYGIDYISLIIPMILLLVPAVLFKDKYSTKQAFMLTFISLFIGIITHMYIALYELDRLLLLYLIVIAVATDVFAYLGGRFIGKHKFSDISPNKTIEGCIAGAIFGTLAGLIYYKCFYVINNGVIVLGITLLLSITGQFGDLFFSKIKRDNEIKDYSDMIPGHGGICDRIDSLTFIVLVFLIIKRFL